MNEAQKKFWKTVAINGILTFVGVTLVLASSDLYDAKKASKTTEKK